MQKYRDEYIRIREKNDINELYNFADKLIGLVECYEKVYENFKDVIDVNFLNKNKNKTVYLTNIIKTTGNNIKRDITYIKKENE